jgi:hypothetical protein
VESREIAQAGYPMSVACRAAAAVPENRISEPRLDPWFMPEITKSGVMPSTPRCVSRIQNNRNFATVVSSSENTANGR